MILTQWQQYLTDNGAEFTDKKLVSFGNLEDELHIIKTTSVISDLSNTSEIIRVSGTDSANFLQNILSNDIHQLDHLHSQLSAHCAPNGRIQSLFRILCHDKDYFLIVPSAIAEGTLKRLQMFVLMSQVKLDLISQQWISIGLSGPHSEDELHQALPDCVLPETPDEVQHPHKQLIITRLHGVHPRFLLTGSPESIQSLWERLDVHAAPIGEDAWALSDILAAVPTLDAQISDKFIPQMLNLQALNGLSFKKGCYPGQEVVARMHYLGKLKRHMRLISFQMTELPEPGTSLFSPNTTSGQGAGHLVNVRPAGNGQINALAVIDNNTVEHGDIRVGSDNGPVVSIQNLPYSLE